MGEFDVGLDWIRGLAATAETLYAVDNGGRVAAVDVETRDVLWRHDGPAGFPIVTCSPCTSPAVKIPSAD